MSIPSSSLRKRVLSGMRPTGKLHLGNYMGALHNWVRLQDEYECYFFIADWHALTTDYADPSQLKQNTVDVALDYLAAGLDPEKSVIFIQSHVPQHAEFHLLLSMMTPLGWLERVPTYKEQQENLSGKDLTTYGFLGYPLLQAADILIYQPDYVPVGQDQVAHVELTREVARRFNFFYPKNRPLLPAAQDLSRKSLEETGFPPAMLSPSASGAAIRSVTMESLAEAFRPGQAILPEPQVLLTPSPKLPGTDGRKMSKSYGNTIGLTEAPERVAQKIRQMSTNGQRPRQIDPGDPELCPVGDLHKIFSSAGTVESTQAGCRSAGIGCLECKSLVIESILPIVAPIHERRKKLEKNVDSAWALLEDGSKKARDRAEETMEQVREAMGLGRKIDALSERFSAGSSTEEIEQKRNLSCIAPFPDIGNYPLDQINFHLRNYWLSELLPKDIAITRDREGQLLTGKKKRVLIEGGTRGADSWTIIVPPKTYDVWVLLCKDEQGWLEDFVVPQSYFSQDFAYTKKVAAAQRSPITVTIKRQGGAYKLFVRDDHEVDISNLRRNYAPLR